MRPNPDVSDTVPIRQVPGRAVRHVGPGRLREFTEWDARTVPLPVHTRAGDAPAKDKGGLGDGLALSISSACGAVAGLAGWLIAARLLPRAEVGLAAAVVSAFMLVGGITQLNLGVALTRWLAVAGGHARVLVWRSLLLISPLGALGGLIYVLVVPALADTAAGPDFSHAFGVVVFGVAAACYSAWVVHDYVLVAVGRPWLAVWRNATFAVVRVGLLVALGSSIGAQGVVLSWVAPMAVWIVVGSVVLFVAVRGFAVRQQGGSLPTRSEVVGFVGPTWLAQVGNNLLLMQVPLLVILRFGPDAGAAFFIAWQATIVADTASTYFTHSLPARWAREPERGPEFAAATRRQLLKIFLPMLGVGALLAGPGLSIFGPNYVEVADVLRLLMLGLAFRLLVVHELAVRTAAGRGVAYARLHLTSTSLVLLAVTLVPVSADADVGAALLPVAWGYVAVQLACAVHVVIVQAAQRRGTSRRPNRDVTRGLR